MADGFIVRRGGKAEEVLRTAVPTINFVSKTDTQIVVTFKNNDTTESKIFYGLTAPLTDSVVLADDTTSSNITFSGLDQNTQYTISAYAIVTDATLKKIKSEVVSTNITTDAPTYTNATGGTTLEYDLDNKRYRSHTFTSNGDFVVTEVGNGDRNQVDYLIIAGGASGGGGGGSHGGGGAGGYRTTITPVPNDQTADSKKTVTATTYGVVIGAGGAAVTNTGNIIGNSGTNSTAFGETVTGGGFGGSSNGASFNGPSGSGGSSGGTGGSSTSVGTRIINEGNLGGLGNTDLVTYGTGGGGGGAGAVGAAGSSSQGGNGGNGLANLLRTGSNETRGGGGGGGGDIRGSRPAGDGGTGGGGAGNMGSGNATSGTANTGGGGGAFGFSSGVSRTSGAGGSGIVIIRYEIAPTT